VRLKKFPDGLGQVGVDLIYRAGPSCASIAKHLNLFPVLSNLLDEDPPELMLVSFVQAITVWSRALEPCGSSTNTSHPKRMQFCPHCQIFSTNTPKIA
jgi:hypothetical protein